MKKIMIVILFIFFLGACSSNNAVEKLKEEYPKTVKNVADELPTKIQEKLAAPTDIPFSAKLVDLTYGANPSGDPKGDILFTEFMYSDGVGVNLHVTTYQYKNTTFSDDNRPFKTISLKNGTQALIIGDVENTKEIRWKKGGLYYSIMLIKSPKSKKKYTIEDIIKTANSMEY